VAMYLMRELTRSTLTQIGDLFGGKTHSTVLYACHKLETEMKEDAELAQAIDGLCTRLQPR
jgi:chromosomal replication initiator protein